MLDELRGDSSGDSLDWETIARILSVREQVARGQLNRARDNSVRENGECINSLSTDNSQLHSIVDSVFKEEFSRRSPPPGETISRFSCQ